MTGKILLVHHGGHRGGYGVCWDLRAPKSVHSHGEGSCKNYPPNQFGIISSEQFHTLQPTAYEDFRDGMTLHCSSKEAALNEAARLGLEVVTPQAISKMLKQERNQKEPSEK